MRFVSGQVAQLVERSPEKAGVGGSIPSLATTKSIAYKTCKSAFSFHFIPKLWRDDSPRLECWSVLASHSLLPIA
jgi:hypothetical protein